MSTPTTVEPIKDVHTAHCCIIHGCKYGWTAKEPCTVKDRGEPQDGPCQGCSELGYLWDAQPIDRLPTLSVVLMVGGKVAQRSERDGNWRAAGSTRILTTADLLVGGYVRVLLDPSGEF